ncbi:MAG: hypothetical protein WKF77_22760 [Planctomycetaceae bacterium]
MTRRQQKRIIDTNVPITANRALDPTATHEELPCILACVNAVEFVVENGGMVIDAGDELFHEYRTNLKLKGQPGVGDKFVKWVHDHRWGFPPEDRVPITRTGDTYAEFPDHEGLKDFDRSDQKFVAVANAHPDKPPILEATDSKWWGWKDSLAEVGITVIFLCEDFVEQKYQEKMGS